MSDNNNKNTTLDFENGTVVIAIRMTEDGDGVKMALHHIYDGAIGENDTQLFLNVLARGLMTIGYSDMDEVIEVGKEVLQETFLTNAAPKTEPVTDAEVFNLADYMPSGRAN